MEMVVKDERQLIGDISEHILECYVIYSTLARYIHVRVCRHIRRLVNISWDRSGASKENEQ